MAISMVIVTLINAADLFMNFFALHESWNEVFKYVRTGDLRRRGRLTK